jgi:hypothetical protein
MGAGLDLLCISVYCTADELLPERHGSARRKLSDTPTGRRGPPRSSRPTVPSERSRSLGRPSRAIAVYTG